MHHNEFTSREYNIHRGSAFPLQESRQQQEKALDELSSVNRHFIL